MVIFYFMPGIVIAKRNILVNKTDKVSALMGWTFGMEMGIRDG